jgi:SAM-dependent methyltransferase
MSTPDLSKVDDARTPDRVRAHYEVEVELADRLREAPPEARRRLYGRVYNELFARVPDHPQLTRRVDPAQQAAYARRQVELIRQFLPDQGTYLEIGAGDCATVRGVAGFAGTATAVEVSSEIVPDDLPANVKVAISDGVSVPIPPGSADLIYSNQLMEHLHPDDALEQLRNIALALKPGGKYLCITPNRLTGPHDISAVFDDEPRGFHLREYTYGELASLLKGVGFRRTRVVEPLHGRAHERLVRLAGRFGAGSGDAIERAGERALTLPLGPYLLAERIAARRRGGGSESRVFRRILGIKILAER